MRYMEAFADMAEKKFDEALKKVELLDEDFGARKLAISLRGDINLKKRDWAAAKSAYDQVLEIDPETPGTFVGLSRVAFAQGDVPAAIDHARTATGLLYHQPIAHYFLGVALYRSGDWQAAERALIVSNKQAPLMAQNYRMLKRIAKHYRDDPAEVVRFELLAQRAVQRKQAEREKRMSVKQSVDTKIRSQKLTLEAHQEKLAGIAESEIATVVTGLPRSGTSLVMQILQAAGISPFTDEARQADESNPVGYFENVDVARLMDRKHSKKWLADASGKAVKVVAPLLPHLPGGLESQSGDRQPINYRVVLIERDLDEILASQASMLQRMDKTPEASNQSSSLATAYRTQLSAAESWLVKNKISALRINHRELMTDPDSTIQRLAEFLNRADQSSEMKSVIRTDLYRSRSTANVSSAV